jgi:hypothetical protein
VLEANFGSETEGSGLGAGLTFGAPYLGLALDF